MLNGPANPETPAMLQNFAYTAGLAVFSAWVAYLFTAKAKEKDRQAEKALMKQEHEHALMLVELNKNNERQRAIDEERERWRKEIARLEREWKREDDLRHQGLLESEKSDRQVIDDAVQMLLPERRHFSSAWGALDDQKRFKQYSELKSKFGDLNLPKVCVRWVKSGTDGLTRDRFLRIRPQA